MSHEVRRAGRAIELSPKEYALPEYLLRKPATPVPRSGIVEEVWRIAAHALSLGAVLVSSDSAFRRVNKLRIED
jgi:DNA-binding response OmpR family regulator